MQRADSYPAWDASRRMALAAVLAILSVFSATVASLDVVEAPPHFIRIYGLEGFSPLHFDPASGTLVVSNNSHLLVARGGEGVLIKARVGGACVSGGSVYASLVPPGIGREWELLEASNGSIRVYRVAGYIVPFSKIVCSSQPILVSSNTVRGVTVVEFMGESARVLEAPLRLAGLRGAAYWGDSVYMVYGWDYYVEVDLGESRALQWLVEIPWATEVYLEGVSVTSIGPLATGRAIVNGSSLGLIVNLATREALLVNWTTGLGVGAAGVEGDTIWVFLRPVGDWGILAEIREGRV
ncbi:MAG: hypothetical protein LRS43_01115, partial [Desulfurococcales archaeon]|nr:hypothetical protein [Desulfurococcales archaeon]